MERLDINKINNISFDWGSNELFKVLDPKANVEVESNAFGTFKVRANNLQLFNKYVAENGLYDSFKYKETLSKIIGDKLISTIGEYLKKYNISIYFIGLYLDDLSYELKKSLANDFKALGLELLDIYISDIVLPKPELNKLALYLEKMSFDLIGNKMFEASKDKDIDLNTSLDKNDTIVCSECGTRFDKNAKECPNCHKKVVTKCPKCGMVVEPGTKYCPECGLKL